MPQLPEILSYQELGGNKVDYAPVEDDSTDRSSIEVNNLCCATAELTQTPVKVWVNFTLGASPLIADGYTAWGAVWKEATPTLPVVTNTGTGVFRVSLPTVVEDARLNGDVHAVNLRSIQHSLTGGSRGFIAATFISGHEVEIKTYNTSNSLSNFTSSDVLNVWII